MMALRVRRLPDNSKLPLFVSHESMIMPAKLLLFLGRLSACWLLAMGAAALFAQQPGPDASVPPAIDQAIHNPRPPFYVNVNVDRPSRDYREGDTLAVRVAAEQDAHVYILYQQADGKTFQVFPNKHQPDNRVRARQAVEVPGDQDLFRWVVGAPFGKETVKVIASKTPIDILSHPAMRQTKFNPVTARQMKGIELDLSEPDDYSETDIAIHTYARDTAVNNSGAKRFGVFFGVSQHATIKYKQQKEEKEEVVELSLGEVSDLRASHTNAQKLAQVMRTTARLNDARVFTNDQATRLEMEEAITRWLPAVSRPGDTVFIYFSGHGARVPDDNGDEPDGFDERLLPHDAMNYAAYKVLHEGFKLEQFPAYLRHQMQRCTKALEGATTDEERNLRVQRETSITDDEMGRWLQKLSGRKVLVIIDACHSGGFARQEKGVKGSAGPDRFDFLDREVTRLKDIGQGDQSMLAACTAASGSVERVEGDLGVMTFQITEFLQQAKGGQKLDPCVQFCRPRVQQYMEALRQAQLPIIQQQIAQAEAEGDTKKADNLKRLAELLRTAGELLVVDGASELFLKP